MAYSQPQHYRFERPEAVFDIECYRNYFSISFKNIVTGKVREFEFFSGHPLDRAAIIRILRQYRLVSFNGNNYDIPMLNLAMMDSTTNSRLKDMSDRIIVGQKKPWEVRDLYGYEEIAIIDHIDMIEVMPSQAGLKEYGGKMHSRKIQDLPIDPAALIKNSQRPVMLEYCQNDLQTTIDARIKFDKQIILRTEMSKEYKTDLRSKSDAQIAEAVIKAEIERIKGEKVYRPDVKPNYTFQYMAPEWIEFDSPELQTALETINAAWFTLKKKTDRNDESEAFNVGDIRIKSLTVAIPKEIKGLKLTIGKSIYRVGNGGLHSSESTVFYETDDEYELHDRDVASYYPSIILNEGYYPAHLGRDFLTVYQRIYTRRMKAKESGDKTTADSLKIVLNGSFGKFGSKWSSLYSPNLMIQVTITGQLALLMLIEQLEKVGIPVVSANTDGIVIRCPRNMKNVMAVIVAEWEEKTGFVTEDTDYMQLYSRDVNNYIAVKPDGSVKLKGAYAPPEPIGSSWPSPANEVCVNAVVAYLTEGTPLMTTIMADKDIRNFVNVRKVKGGAVWHSEFLGKVVRWYYGVGQTGCIQYRSNGNKVPKSDGAMPLMELPEEFPDDVNYEWYAAEARSILADVGAL
jgi:hypothetical protein